MSDKDKYKTKFNLLIRLEQVLNIAKDIQQDRLKHIKQRAELFVPNIKIDGPILRDLDMDQYPISIYDLEDRENHNFDLGGYYAIKEFIDELNKLNK